MTAVSEPESGAKDPLPASIVVPERVVSLAEQAGLDRALESFPADVLVAARVAAEMTTAMRRLGDPGRAPWPPMRTSRLP